MVPGDLMGSASFLVGDLCPACSEGGQGLIAALRQSPEEAVPGPQACLLHEWHPLAAMARTVDQLTQETLQS